MEKSQKQINKKVNPKKIVVHIQTANGDCSSFSVLVKRDAKVGKLQGKIKNQQGIAKVNQRLQLLPSRRDLQSEEILDTLLPQDQDEMTVSLVVLGPSHHDEGGQAMRKPLAKNKKKQASIGSEGSSPSTSLVVEEPSASLAEPNSCSPFVSSSSSSPLKTGDNHNDDVVIIKLSFEEHHRRLPFEHRAGANDVSFERLTNACTQFFGIKNVHRMVLSYEDEDGDRVQLSTDAELAYALDHYTRKSSSSSSEGLPVLKLRFCVKAIKKQQQQDDEAPLLAPSSSSSPSPLTGDQDSCEKQKGACHSLQRKLQDGDVIVLQAQREGEAYNLAFCKKDQSVVAARQTSSNDENSSINKKGNSPFPKNAQWVVSKFKAGEETEGNVEKQEDIFFLSCKAFDSSVSSSEEKEVNGFKKDKKQNNGKKNLRVLSNASVNHQGGRGVWARFAIVQTSTPSGQQFVTLRCVGRSKLHPENSFLGISKNKNKKKDNASSSRQFVVAGDLNQNSDDTKFTLHFL